MSDSRVLITGLGLVCCLGQDVPTFWRRLVAGESGIGPITRFPTEGLRNPHGGEVRDWQAPSWLPQASSLDRATQFALAAAEEAWRDAGLPTPGEGKEEPRWGAVLATNFGGGDSWELFFEGMEEDTPEEAEALLREFLFQAAARQVAERFGLRGPLWSLSNSCSSGASAIGLATDLLRRGEADLLLAGAYDSLSQSNLAGLNALRVITPEKVRPFDKNRSGTLFGEGAAVLVLEREDHALRRGARPYAEVLGSSMDNNAYHMTAPDPGGRGIIHALRLALRDAGLAPEEIDYINAHATGTQYHDKEEAGAILAVFGEHARRVPVSSIKAATAHPMAAAGAVEAIACVLALREGLLPPTLNYETPDPECPLDVVPNEARPWRGRTVLSISAGIGGNNGVVVLRREGL